MTELADGTDALKTYWTRGEGAAKIRWGTDGAFDRCVRELRDKVRDPQGLCATYEHAATGHWPADRAVESAGETTTMAADTVLDPASDAELTDEWHGILTVEGIETGDGRYFAPNSLTWPDGDLPLRWCPEDEGEHKKAYRVGNINRIERRPVEGAENVFEIWGHGTFDVADEHGRKIRDKMARGYASGNSVDVDSLNEASTEIVFAESGSPETIIFHAGRIRATTLVDIPAFVEAKIGLGAEQRQELYGLVAAGAISMPQPLIFPGPAPEVLVAAAVEGEWLPALHFSQIASRVTEGWTSPEQARLHFAYVPPPLPDGRVNLSECRYLHHTATADGTPGLPNLTACSASIHALNTRPGRLDPLELRAAYDHLAAHLVAAGITPAPFTAVAEVGEPGVEVAVTAAVLEAADCPPAEWFTDPGFAGPTGLTVSDDGRVFGHGALWGTCHVGMPGTCVNPPEELAHDYYRLGEVRCADGSRVPVGQITLGTGHAPTSGVSWRGAADHYDNTGTVVADVATGNDAYGIWVSGALRPGVSAAQVRELMGAKLSGDWRKIAGSLRLVAFLAVNVPGFPVPRMKAGMFAGEQLALVAAGVVTEAAVVERVEVAEPVVEVDREATGRARLALLKRLGRDPETLRAGLAARLKIGA